MAEYKVTLSELESASSQLKSEADEYMNTADALRTAADNLTGQDWVGEASETYGECIQELYTWMSEMTAIVQSFGTVLTEARDIYSQADADSAAQFK